MRVLYLTELLTNGGTAKHVTEMVPRLLEHDIEPIVFSRGEQGMYAKVLVESGVRLEYTGNLYTRLLDACRNESIDLVHSYLYGPHLMDAVICRLLGVPYVKSTRNEGHWYRENMKVKARIAIRSKLVKHHIVNGDGARRYLVETEGVNPARITVIHNGLLDRFQQGPFLERAMLDIPEDAVVFISVAWLKKQKNLSFLIDAFSMLHADCHQAFLLLLGDGPLEAELRQHVDELGIGDHCRFLGRRPEVHSYLRLSDVYVSTSKNEGMSNATLEAQMMGIPSIVTSVASGNREIIEHGSNGLLFDANDMEELVGHLRSLYWDISLRKQFAAAARTRFLSQFNMDNQIKSYVQYYKELV